MDFMGAHVDFKGFLRGLLLASMGTCLNNFFYTSLHGNHGFFRCNFMQSNSK